MGKILKPLTYIKYKINDKRFGPKLAAVIYQYCINPNCRPTSLDKVEVVGYCQVLRSNHGLLPNQYCNDFDENRDECNVIVLYNPEEEWYTYIVLPVVDNGHDVYKYIFYDTYDLCYWNIRDGFIDETSIISNSSGDEALVETSAFDEGRIPGEKLFPKHYIAFSKLCLKYCGKPNIPSLQEMIDKFNKK